MQDEPVSSPDAPRHRWYALYALAVLFSIHVLASIDRQILAVMVDPIRQQFNLDDSQISLLPGLAFVLVYVTAAFPMARIADRHRRTSLLAGGLAVWSVGTGLFAMARNYWQLFLCRMGVGLGESCLNPSAMPLLADYFSERNLGKAVATYMLAVPVGSGVASMLGGEMVKRFSPEHGFVLGAFGSVRPWQLLLLVLCAMGFLLLLLLLTVREPARRNAVTGAAAVNHSLTAVWQLLRTNACIFIAVALPLLTSALVYFGVGYWMPSYFIRGAAGDNQVAGELVFYWGTLNVAVGALGVLVGGCLADYLSARHSDGMWKTLGIGVVLLGFGFSLFVLGGEAKLALVLLVPGVLGNGIIQAAGITTVLKIAPNHMRGQIAALFFLLVNVVGAGLGPSWIALLSDSVFGGAAGNAGLGHAMAATAGVTTVASLLMLIYTNNAYRQLKPLAV